MNFDLAINLWIHNTLTNPFLDLINQALSWIGDGYVWIALIILLLFFKSTRYIGINLLVAVILSFAACEIIKHIVMRPRPFMDYEMQLIVAVPRGSSFPSAHSATSFSLAVSYFLCAKTKPWNYYRWPFIVLAGLISLSRLYLFVHYPTDVATGIFIGCLSGYLAIKIVNQLIKKGYLDRLDLQVPKASPAWPYVEQRQKVNSPE